MRRQIDEAMASAATGERTEEEAKGECEVEREEAVRMDIEMEGEFLRGDWEYEKQGNLKNAKIAQKCKTSQSEPCC